MANGYRIVGSRDRAKRVSAFQAMLDNMVHFSVILPTYANDDPDELGTAIESVVDQTRVPDEVLIIKDGELTSELESTVEQFEMERSSLVTSVQIPTNRGLGNALRTGVEEATYDYVARMDADDISVPTRFEQQIDFLTANPDVDIVGGYIDEFETDPSNPVARREVPTGHQDIEQMARFRSPMNHATVIFDKTTVYQAGNYRPVDPMEDYDLWVRMLLDGATFANIPKVLVNVRAGAEMYERRGGWEYAHKEVRTQIEFYQRGFISLPIFLFNTTFRTGLRLIPEALRTGIYRKLAR